MDLLQRSFVFNFILLFYIATTFGYNRHQYRGNQNNYKHQQRQQNDQTQDLFRESYASELQGQDLNRWREQAADAITEIHHAHNILDVNNNAPVKVVDRHETYRDEVREGPHAVYDYAQQKYEHQDENRQYYNEHQERQPYNDHQDRQDYNEHQERQPYNDHQDRQGYNEHQDNRQYHTEEQIRQHHENQQRQEYEQRLQQERQRYEEDKRRYEEEQKRYEADRLRYEQNQHAQGADHQRYDHDQEEQKRYEQERLRYEQNQHSQTDHDKYNQDQEEQKRYEQERYEQERQLYEQKKQAQILEQQRKYEQQKYEQEKQRYYDQQTQSNYNPQDYYPHQQYDKDTNTHTDPWANHNRDNLVHTPYYPTDELPSTDEHRPIDPPVPKIDHQTPATPKETDQPSTLTIQRPNNLNDFFKSILSQFQTGFPQTMDPLHNPFPGATILNSQTDIFGGIALTDSAIFDVLDGNSKPTGGKQWWKGPHVCLNRTESNDGDGQEQGNIQSHIHTSSCEESELSYTCTTRVRTAGFSKTMAITYQCCHGYRRETGQFGCNQVQLNDLVQTATLLGASQLILTIDKLGLSGTLQSDNFTLFAPNDAAFNAYQQVDSNKEKPHNQQGMIAQMGAEHRQDMRTVVLGHVSRGFLRMSQLNDDQMVPTVNGDSSIRINIYKTPQKVITADCARVLSVNNDATNGVIHLIDRVITPATQSIMDIITRDSQFSMLKTVLSRAGMVQTLRGEGKYTIFAPTDAAFAKLNQAVKDRLFRDNNCLMTVLKSHILPNVLCSAVIQGQARAASMMDKYLVIHRDQDSKLFVNDNQIVRSDIVGTNGVIHIIDGVIIPEEAKTITMIAEDAGVTEILRLLETAGIRGNLEMFENITFFAPSNDAIRNLPRSVLDDMRSDPRKLREIILYHVAKPQTKICDMRNNQPLETYHGGSIIMNEYISRNPFQFGFGQSRLTAGCANIVGYDKQGCNGVMHIIDKVLTPSQGKILDIIAANRTFSTLRRLIRDAGLEDILRGEGPYTLFAPTDQAFFSLPEEELTELTRNRDKLDKILKLHILPENLCCTGINQDTWFLSEHKRSLEGTAVRVHRDNYGNMQFANAGVVTCDLIANNGIVHVIDKVIVPIGF